MREESAGPLGVIGCLRAGFEMLSRNLGLVALPVLLDLILWLGPRLSIAPLLQQFVALLTARPLPDPAAARQVEQAVQLLELFGEQFNLLSLLSVLPLLNVPSLLVKRVPGMLSPLGESNVVLVKYVFALTTWGMLLGFVGLVLGFLYLNGLARRVCAMRPPDEQGPALSKDQAATEISGGAKFLRIFLFAAGVLAVLAAAWLGGRAGLFQNIFITAIGLLVVSPLLVIAAYAVLRDDELEPYRGVALYVRSAICALAYVVLWGAYSLLVSGGVITGDVWNWAFVAPPLE